MTQASAPDLTIVIVDDDPGHCELVTRSLRRAGMANRIVAIHSGCEAVSAILQRRHDGPLPPDGDVVVLLDINIPGGLNGIDVLAAIRNDPVARAIPVIMLTTTDDPRDIKRCYEIGCDVYVTKPVDPAHFADAVRRLGLASGATRNA